MNFKRLSVVLLALLIARSPAYACSELEMQSQRLAAIANNICQLGNEGAIEKGIAKELYFKRLETLQKDYDTNEPLGKERLTRVFTLLNLECELSEDNGLERGIHNPKVSPGSSSGS